MATKPITTVTTVSTTSTSTSTTTTFYKGNWIINGDAETGPCETGNGVTSPTDWNYNGTIAQAYYNNIVSDQNAITRGPSNRGRCHFYAQLAAVTSMWQYVNMTPEINPVLIRDNQTVHFNFSAWLGGYSTQNDNAQVSFTFINQFDVKVDTTITLGPVLAIDHSSITSLILRQANGIIPAGARSSIVTVILTVSMGPSNDGDVYNIILYLTQ